MKLFFSSSDGVEMEIVMDMLAQAGIRYQFDYDPRSQTDAQLWVQDNGDFSTAASMLTACQDATR
jgi:hypothetical protein